MRAYLLEEAHEVAAAQVSNGYVRTEAGQDLLFDSAAAIEVDPIKALLTRNWLAAAGGLYRTSSISEDFFNPSIRSLDMTYLALRLAMEKRICFVDQPTFRKNKTGGSVSTSDAWMLAAKDTLQAMLELPLMAHHRSMLEQKIGAAWHDLADYHCRTGNTYQAWVNHAHCLVAPRGLSRYGGFTGRLMLRSLRRFLARQQGA